MAASNQMPRARGVGGTRAVPDWLRKRGYLIAVAGFFGIAGARLAGLDRNGAAMGTVRGGSRHGRHGRPCVQGQ